MSYYRYTHINKYINYYIYDKYLNMHNRVCQLHALPTVPTTPCPISYNSHSKTWNMSLWSVYPIAAATSSKTVKSTQVRLLRERRKTPDSLWPVSAVSWTRRTPPCHRRIDSTESRIRSASFAGWRWCRGLDHVTSGSVGGSRLSAWWRSLVALPPPCRTSSPWRAAGGDCLPPSIARSDARDQHRRCASSVTSSVAARWSPPE